MESLPTEILTQIFDYISFEDRRQAALVNRKWNYATLHPRLLKRELIYFDKSTFDPLDSMVRSDTPIYNDFKQTFFKSKRRLFNIVLQFKKIKAHLEDVTIFMNLGVHIKYLCLEDLKWLSDSFLDSITTYCRSLESLILRNIYCLPITEKTRAPLLNLNYLTFDTVALSDMSFNILINCIPSLKDICIVNCQMLVWPQAIKRFYPHYRDQATLTNYNSKDVFTDVNFIRFLKTANCINSLKLEEYPHILLKLPKGIKLHYFALDSVTLKGLINDPKADINNYISVLSRHTSLQRLDIVCCSCCSLLSVMPKLVNLKRVTVQFSTILHPDCLENDTTVVQNFYSSLSCNKHIRSLSIIFSPYQFVHDCRNNVFEIPDCVLKSLTTLNCPIINSLKLIHFGKNLTSLEIPNGKVLTADDLKLLFKNLTNLRKLIINDCKELNDDILVESPISNLKGLDYLSIMDGNLTYQCFPFIKLADLKTLNIGCLSLGQCIDKNDMTDFENGFKEFGCYVPALTSLGLQLTPEDYLKANDLEFDLHDYFSNQKFLSYFKILKYFGI